MNTYWTQCDKLRADAEGECAWGVLMEFAKEISLEEFEQMTDARGLLDDGETIEEFCASDPDSGFFVTVHDITFVQTSGFEFFFRKESTHGTK